MKGLVHPSPCLQTDVSFFYRPAYLPSASQDRTIFPAFWQTWSQPNPNPEVRTGKEAKAKATRSPAKRASEDAKRCVSGLLLGNFEATSNEQNGRRARPVDTNVPFSNPCVSSVVSPTFIHSSFWGLTFLGLRTFRRYNHEDEQGRAPE